jgi:hypothetical protein
VVVDIVSSEGRRMLAMALENLQLRMTCHFDAAFTSVFKELIDAFLTTSVPELRQLHDLVLRYQVEVLIFKFFKDVFTSNRSEMFPDCCLKTPAGCAELLRRYVGKFVRGLPKVPQQPHYLFLWEDIRQPERTCQHNAAIIQHNQSVSGKISDRLDVNTSMKNGKIKTCL